MYITCTIVNLEHKRLMYTVYNHPLDYALMLKQLGTIIHKSTIS
jgi:hypothetical protein